MAFIYFCFLLFLAKKKKKKKQDQARALGGNAIFPFSLFASFSPQTINHSVEEIIKCQVGASLIFVRGNLSTAELRFGVGVWREGACFLIPFSMTKA